jgi:hypothetical protein
MRITSDAYVRLASGTGGIQFNGDTAAANALDDYEEGTWTPAYAFSGGGSVTTTVAVGRYTKVGNTVIAAARIYTSAISSPSGNVTITGLPFSSASITHLRSNGSVGQASSFGTDMQIKIEIDQGNSAIELRKNASNAVGAEVQGSDFASGAAGNLLDFTITYYTA